MLAIPFALFFFVVTVVESGSLQYKWIDDVGSCKLHYIPATWQEARLRCNNEGGALASNLKPHLLTPLMNEFNRDQVFLGIHATFDGEYYSINGTSLDSMTVKWAPNEPNNFEGSENCLVLNSNGTVADVKCSLLLPYICCKDSKQAGDQREQSDGYICNKSIGSCYKFHSKGTTWTRAFRDCAAESGHLAVVNSQLEARYIADMTDKIPSSSIDAHHKDFSFIGFRAWGEPPIWLTIHGQPLDQAGYLHWGPGQPDNSTGFRGDGENCGSIFFNGQTNKYKFNDVSCEKIVTYICERKMDNVMSDERQYFGSFV